jgi:predicted nucleic acid-binding protein
MEVQQGIEKLKRQSNSAKAPIYEMWLVDIIEQFDERILDFDTACAKAAGQLSDRAVAIGRHPGFPDIAIAATARVHDLAILTRNIRHFQPLDIDCLDPFEVA